MSLGDQQSLQRELLRALAERLQHHDFRLRLSWQDFVKKIPGGRWVLHLAFIAHPSDCDVTADVAIRIDAVEELVQRTDQHLSAKEKRETATAGAELGNIADRRQHRWTVATAADVVPVADQIYKMFEDFGLPYLERLSEPGALLDALSRNDPAGWIHAPFHGARNKRAVALALTSGDRERARELARRGARYLRDRNDHALADFEAFVRDALGE